MNRRYLFGVIGLLLAGLAASGCGGDDGGAEFAFGLGAETVASGGVAEGVTAIEFAPDGRIFFAEQFKGTIRIINEDGALQAEPFTQIVVDDWLGQDWGLTGLALDPEFEDNHYVYAFYTEFVRTVTLPGDDGSTQEHHVGQPKIVRFTEADGVAEDTTLITDDFPETDERKPGYNANGEIHFGPDGFLYASVGDYDLFGDDPDVIKDLSSPIGKLLRMDKEDGSAPDDNPFVDDADTDPRVYAYGFREPFPFTFDTEGAIYGTDNTTVSCEELNVILPGENYGWPDMGIFPFSDCGVGPGEQPITHFSREGMEPNGFISFVEVSGLSFLADGPYALLSDSLIVCESQKSPDSDRERTNGVLRRLVIADGAVTSDDVIVKSCRNEARVAPDGTIYYATDNEIRKLITSDDEQGQAPSP
ncbi:MAG: PQQ-dependent sugar dehydrogenase [Dehalococcoidia bacterium]